MNDSEHLAVPGGQSLSDEEQAFEDYYAENGGPQRMHKSYGPGYVEKAEEQAAKEAWLARATLAAAAPQADALDAKRYRLLRRAACDEEVMKALEDGNIDPKTPEEVDAAVDAAIAKGP